MKSKNKPVKKADIDTQAAVEALEYLLAAGYVSRKKLYVENFVRGLVFSFGSVLGATALIALLVWLLAHFDTAPLVGHYIKAIQHSINQTSTKN